MDQNQPAGESKKTIFIVEDDMLLVSAYEIKFKKENVDVWVAQDGKEAVTFLTREPADIVLLDLMLPGMSGYEVLAEIRKNDKWKNVPVIVLTNLGQSQDVEKAKSLGVADYLVKADTKINDITEKVKKYLN
jgi:DNA-binding response OmpR family regulator